MARYIDADKLIEEIVKAKEEIKTDNDALWGINKKTYGILCRLRRMVDDMPTADVSPKSEVEHWKKEANRYQTIAKAEVAREICTKFERLIRLYNSEYSGATFTDSWILAVLKEIKEKYKVGNE